MLDTRELFSEKDLGNIVQFLSKNAFGASDVDTRFIADEDGSKALLMRIASGDLSFDRWDDFTIPNREQFNRELEQLGIADPKPVVKTIWKRNEGSDRLFVALMEGDRLVCWTETDGNHTKERHLELFKDHLKHGHIGERADRFGFVDRVAMLAESQTGGGAKEEDEGGQKTVLLSSKLPDGLKQAIGMAMELKDDHYTQEIKHNICMAFKANQAILIQSSGRWFIQFKTERGNIMCRRLEKKPTHMLLATICNENPMQQIYASTTWDDANLPANWPTKPSVHLLMHVAMFSAPKQVEGLKNFERFLASFERSGQEAVIEKWLEIVSNGLLMPSWFKCWAEEKYDQPMLAKLVCERMEKHLSAPKKMPREALIEMFQTYNDWRYALEQGVSDEVIKAFCDFSQRQCFVFTQKNNEDVLLIADNKCEYGLSIDPALLHPHLIGSASDRLLLDDIPSTASIDPLIEKAKQSEVFAKALDLKMEHWQSKGAEAYLSFIHALFEANEHNKWKDATTIQLLVRSIEKQEDFSEGIIVKQLLSELLGRDEWYFTNREYWIKCIERIDGIKASLYMKALPWRLRALGLSQTKKAPSKGKKGGRKKPVTTVYTVLKRLDQEGDASVLTDGERSVLLKRGPIDVINLAYKQYRQALPALFDAFGNELSEYDIQCCLHASITQGIAMPKLERAQALQLMKAKLVGGGEVAPYILPGICFATLGDARLPDDLDEETVNQKGVLRVQIFADSPLNNAFPLYQEAIEGIFKSSNWKLVPPDDSSSMHYRNDHYMLGFSFGLFHLFRAPSFLYQIIESLQPYSKETVSLGTVITEIQVSPLMLACMKGSLEKVQHLLSAGASIDKDVLIVALLSENVEISRLLISQVDDSVLDDSLVLTAYLCLAKEIDLECVSKMATSVKDLNRWGTYDAIVAAMRRDDYDLVQYLIPLVDEESRWHHLTRLPVLQHEFDSLLLNSIRALVDSGVNILARIDPRYFVCWYSNLTSSSVIEDFCKGTAKNMGHAGRKWTQPEHDVTKKMNISIKQKPDGVSLLEWMLLRESRKLSIEALDALLQDVDVNASNNALMAMLLTGFHYNSGFFPGLNQQALLCIKNMIDDPASSGIDFDYEPPSKKGSERLLGLVDNLLARNVDPNRVNTANQSPLYLATYLPDYVNPKGVVTSLLRAKARLSSTELEQGAVLLPSLLLSPINVVSALIKESVIQMSTVIQLGPSLSAGVRDILGFLQSFADRMPRSFGTRILCMIKLIKKELYPELDEGSFLTSENRESLERYIKDSSTGIKLTEVTIGLITTKSEKYLLARQFRAHVLKHRGGGGAP